MSDGPSAALSRLRRPAAVFTSQPRRQLVLVLGTDRRATAVCSRALRLLSVEVTGSDVASSEPAGSFNGHAPNRIADWQDRVLACLNRNFGTPFYNFPLPLAWWGNYQVSEIRRDITDFLNERIGEECFAVDDPRTVRLLPMWRQIANELRATLKFVLCLSHPVQAAETTNGHDELPEHYWFLYMIDFFRYINHGEFFVIQHKDWMEHPEDNLARLVKFLDLAESANEIDRQYGIIEALKPELGDQASETADPRLPMVRRLYELTASAMQEPTALEQIRKVASQFVSFQQFEAPLLRKLEETTVLQRSLSEVEKEASSLASMLANIEHQHAEIREIAVTAEVRLTQTQAENEALRGDLDAAARDRDFHIAELAAAAARAVALERDRDERTTELNAVNIDLVAAGERVKQAEARIGEAQAVIDRLRDDLDAVARDRDFRVVELAGTVARARTLEREREEHVAALNAARTELASTGERAVQAEARIGEAQAVIDRLRDDLDAVARDRDFRVVELAGTVARARTLEREEHVAALNAARTELASTGERVVQAEARIGEAQAEVERVKIHLEGVMRSRNAYMEFLDAAVDRLSIVDKAHDEAVAALNTLQADLEMARSEVSERDAALATANERISMATSMQAQIGSLNEKLIRAGRELDKHSVAGTSMRSEIGRLRNELCTARRVGRAILLALVADLPLKINYDESSTWWSKIRRTFGFRLR